MFARDIPVDATPIPRGVADSVIDARAACVRAPLAVEYRKHVHVVTGVAFYRTVLRPSLSLAI
jgi:hypothetical protein